MTGIERLLRIGIVSSVSGNRARVYFPDQDNMVSDWLYIIKQGESWTPSVNDRVLVLYSKGTDTDGFILGVIT